MIAKYHQDIKSESSKKGLREKEGNMSVSASRNHRSALLKNKHF